MATNGETAGRCWLRHVPILIIALTLMGLLTGILMTAQAGIDVRVRAVEQAQAAQAERDKAIRETLVRIEKALERLQERLPPARQPAGGPAGQAAGGPALPGRNGG